MQPSVPSLDKSDGPFMLQGYVPPTNVYDEAVQPQGELRAHYRDFYRRLQTLGTDEFQRRWAQIQQALHENGIAFGAPRMRLAANRPYLVSQAVAEASHPEDLIITSGADRLFLYLPYFADRQVVSLYHLLRAQPAGRDAVWQELARLAERTQSEGREVYLVGLEPGHEVWWDVMAGVGASREEIGARLGKPVAWTRVLIVAGEEVIRLAR